MIFSDRPLKALSLGVALVMVSSPALSQESASAEDRPSQARLEAPAAVYEAVIEALADGVETVILLPDTQGCFPDDSTSSLLGADNVGQAQRECAAKGQRGSMLLDIEALSPAVQIIDRRDLVGQEFYSTIGLEQPAIRLSRPGFSHDSTTVVLHGTRYCGHLCGSTHLFTLEKRAGNWIVINDAVLGIT